MRAVDAAIVARRRCIADDADGMAERCQFDRKVAECGLRAAERPPLGRFNRVVQQTGIKECNTHGCGLTMPCRGAAVGATTMVRWATIEFARWSSRRSIARPTKLCPRAPRAG